MTKLYKIASIIYRIGLAIFIPILFFAFAITDDESEQNNLELKGTLTILFIVVTITLLTVYQNFMIKLSVIRKNIWLFLIVLLSINEIYILKLLFSMLFIYKTFSIGDNIASCIIFLFGLITATVLLGLIKKHYEE